ncbi:hypothetical protein GCM10010913_03440 [Paenibacillus aceti]|uniref:Uncharacterized protein n=1 Tax=Paenibacillus aceti TaxID=1820010 RepID=A0ABQ1VNV9_9BACL|nr:hypothetical protein GCM10010913_03440 [Paenibacillus aceti]
MVAIIAIAGSTGITLGAACAGPLLALLEAAVERECGKSEDDANDQDIGHE